MASGLLTELGFGKNTQAMLLTRGLVEIARLIKVMGADTSTLLGLAGIGDIIATCTSPISRNFQAGALLARGIDKVEIQKQLGMTVEGINTIQVAYQIGQQRNLDLPITVALHQIAFEKKPVDAALIELMQRPSSYEIIG